MAATNDTEKESFERVIIEAVKKYRDDGDTDLYLYNGWMLQDEVSKFIEAVLANPDRRSNVTLVLATWGGDAHEAFRLASFLQKLYKQFRLLVVGPCKSAGTLVAVGANKIAFGPLGELGPLDVQLRKHDDMVYRSSGLDTLQGLAIVTGHLYESFRDFMFQIIEDTKGAISTKTASEIASNLASGLVNPIAAQIDPHRLGEVERIINVAKFYGEKLGKPNLKPNALDILVQGYPSHQCIIDEQEARLSIFNDVDSISEIEQRLLALLPGNGADPEPSGGILVIDAGEAARYFAKAEEQNAQVSRPTEAHAGDRGDAESADETESGDSEDSEARLAASGVIKHPSRRKDARAEVSKH